ncbi:uncharacterized protein LOC127534217 [Acanthochromis polyacanthus]|uniref:uncharacterized protein LOC127534217 n=1 Tax=Acanthochromis polyacanthus TaxID=80966 RepID=UPI0022344886|nr:uncharacterized protein LOC127534217 [Acanthochromis polyacanthus]
MSKKSTFTVTAASSDVTMSSVSTPTTSVNPTSASSDVTMSSVSTPATSVNPTSGSFPPNLSSENTVTSAVRTTTNPTPGGNDADVERESSTMSTKSAFTVTTGSTVIMSSVSPPITSVNLTPAATVKLLKLLMSVAAFGVSIAVVLLVLVLHRHLKRRTGSSSSKTKANITDESVCLRNISHGGVELPVNSTYSLITSVPSADCSTGFEKLNREEPQSQDSDIYHLYETIPDRPTASDQPDMVYSLLQAY